MSASQRRDNAFQRAQDSEQYQLNQARNRLTSKQVMAERRRNHLVQAGHVSRSNTFPSTNEGLYEEDAESDKANSDKLESRLSEASRRRQTWIDSIVRQGKISDANRHSKRFLATVRNQRDRRNEFMRLQKSQRDADQRRKQRIEAIQHRAASRNEKVEGTAKQVKAAKQLQGWWRNNESSHNKDSRVSPTAIADKAMHRVHFSPLRKAVSPELSPSGQSKAQQVPLFQLNPADEGVSNRKEASHAKHEADDAVGQKAFESLLVGPDTSRKIKCVHKAKRYFVAERSQKSLLTLAKVLAGTYQKEEEENTSDRPSRQRLAIRSSTDNLSTTLSMLDSNTTPYSSFEDVATIIQQHDVLSATSFFVRLLVRVYRILNPLIPQPTSDVYSSDNVQDDSHTYSLSADDALASDGSLRPSIARSPRSFLAGLLIAWYPNDILHFRKADANAEDSRQSQIERILMHNARVMLNAFEALLSAVHEHCEQGSTPSATPKERYETADDPESSLKARFESESTFSHVKTLLSCTTLEHNDIQMLPRKTVLLLHRILAFNATWCEYMDSFMAWKVGDGARIAQALAKPFRDLIQRREQYIEEVEATEGRDAGAQQLLDGVNSQLRQLNHQLVRLVGQRSAERWQNDQINTMKKMKQLDFADEDADSGKGMSRTSNDANARRKNSRFSRNAEAVSTPSETTASASAAGVTARGESTASDEHSHIPSSAKQSPSMGIIKQVMSNELLVHELLLEEEFQYPQPECPVDVFFEDSNGFEGSRNALRELQQLRSQVKGETLNLENKASRDRVAEKLIKLFSDSLGYATESGKEKYSSSYRYHKPIFWAEQLGMACLRGNEEGISIILSTIEKVRESLIELIPHRTDLHEHIRGKIDLDFFHQMMQSNTFNLETWMRVLQFCVQLIQQLEAPARQELTNRWLKGAEQRLNEYMKSDEEKREGLLLSASLLELLPRGIAFLLFKIEQIRMDMANFHLSTLKPFLQANDKGVEYELKKFNEKLEKGEICTKGTRVWLKETLKDITEHSVGASMPRSEALNVLTFDDVLSRLSVIRDGVLLLLTSRLPLDTVCWIASQSSEGIAMVPVGQVSSVSEDSSSVKYFCLEEIQGPDGQKYQKIPFPEIFRMDAKRFTKCQNDFQRCTLVAVLGSLVLEFLRSSPPSSMRDRQRERQQDTSGLTVKNISDFHHQLNAWLLDDNVELADIKAGIHQATADLAFIFGKYGRLKEASSTNELDHDSSQKLNEIVESAISYKHPVFAVYYKRLYELLRFKVTEQINQLKGPSLPKQRISQHQFYPQPEPSSQVKRSLPAASAEDFQTMSQTLSRVVVHVEKVFGHNHLRPILRELNDTHLA